VEQREADKKLIEELANREQLQTQADARLEEQARYHGY